MPDKDFANLLRLHDEAIRLGELEKRDSTFRAIQQMQVEAAQRDDDAVQRDDDVVDAVDAARFRNMERREG